MTQIIVGALEITGQRGIINKGWGGLGSCKFLHSLVSLCGLVCYISSKYWESCLHVWLHLLFLSSVAEPKESIYLLDNCPHDWLFPRCAAVVRLADRNFSVTFRFLMFSDQPPSQWLHGGPWLGITCEICNCGCVIIICRLFRMHRAQVSAFELRLPPPPNKVVSTLRALIN